MGVISGGGLLSETGVDACWLSLPFCHCCCWLKWWMHHKVSLPINIGFPLYISFVIPPGDISHCMPWKTKPKNIIPTTSHIGVSTLHANCSASTIHVPQISYHRSLQFRSKQTLCHTYPISSECLPESCDSSLANEHVSSASMSSNALANRSFSCKNEQYTSYEHVLS